VNDNRLLIVGVLNPHPGFQGERSDNAHYVLIVDGNAVGPERVEGYRSSQITAGSICAKNNRIVRRIISVVGSIIVNGVNQVIRNRPIRFMQWIKGLRQPTDDA